MINEKYPNFFLNFREITEIKKLSIMRADHIICISNSTKADLINYFNNYDFAHFVKIVSSIEVNYYKYLKCILKKDIFKFWNKYFLYLIYRKWLIYLHYQ